MICVGSVCEIICVEVEAACVRVFHRGGCPCLWIELCVTLQYRDHFCNCYTHTQRVAVELCDIPVPCSCCPPRVEVCGTPFAVICDGQIQITAPVRIC